MPYKVGIIGAARRHQGTGPYIARIFAQLGHQIVGIIGTSDLSAHEAKQQLKLHYAIDTQAHTSFNQLATQHDLDIIVISSPPSTHLDYLQQALTHGCHVFCEKPLWWPDQVITKEDYLSKIESIVHLAQEKQCFLHLNTQWPYTLKDFYQLQPKVYAQAETHQFAMYLSPQSDGVSMLVDAASHGLSMLYQLMGRGSLHNIDIISKHSDTEVKFEYIHESGACDVELHFIRSLETPKPASYQINGCLVKRIVTLPEYQIQLQSGQQTIAIQDPLEASIHDFLASIDAKLEIDEISIKLGAHHLYQLIEQFYKS